MYVVYSLDIEKSKVAVICAKEKVNPKMKDIVEAANHKGITHQVVGNADILLAPDIESENILYKSLVFFSESKNVGVIVGVKAPIILTLRADNEELEFEKILRHSSDEIGRYERISEQFEFRKKVIENALNEDGVKISELSAVVGRGGLLKPIQGGNYMIDGSMIEDLTIGVLGDYTLNLGGLIAK